MTAIRHAPQPGLPAGVAAPPVAGPAFLQADVLDRLLARMTPAQQGALIAQLSLDLTKASADLASACADNAPAGIRRALHNLIALAGTVGCDDLSTAASDLQHLTKSASDTAQTADIAPLQRMTAALIVAIASHPAAAARTAP